MWFAVPIIGIILISLGIGFAPGGMPETSSPPIANPHVNPPPAAGPPAAAAPLQPAAKP